MNFPILYAGPVSDTFKNLGITNFQDAAEYVKQLPYGRNTNKSEPLCVIHEGRGTCSTKHILLWTLAEENYFIGLDLTIGMYSMNAENTPPVAGTLKKYHLSEIPEAHVYLHYGNSIYDYTTTVPFKFSNYLIRETTVKPTLILESKVKFHKDYLKRWSIASKINYDVEELWLIREECIESIVEFQHVHIPME